MPQKKHKPVEIVAKLRQVEVLLSQGHSVAEAVRWLCQSNQTDSSFPAPSSDEWA